MRHKMENKENNPIQEIDASELIVSEWNHILGVKKRVYSSNVYTFASKNRIQLPEKPEKIKLSKHDTSSSSSSNDEEEDEDTLLIKSVFYDVADESLIRANEIAQKLKREYGINGCLLSAPIPIRQPTLKRSPSFIF